MKNDTRNATHVGGIPRFSIPPLRLFPSASGPKRNTKRNGGSRKLENILKMAIVSTMLAVPKTDGQVIVAYAPSNTATVTAPVVGVGGNENNYFLALGTNEFATLDKSLSNFNSFDSDTIFTTPFVDLAFGDGKIYALNNEFVIRRYNTDGSLDNSFTSVNAGDGAFGLGFADDKLGVFKYNAGDLSFGFLDNGSVNYNKTFGYNQGHWGTLTGAAYTSVNGQGRFLLSSNNPGNFNAILDMNSVTGSIDQYAVSSISGLGNNITDVHFDKDSNGFGHLVVGYSTGSDGLVHVVPYNPIPEPALIGVAAGVFALGAAAVYKRRERKADKPL